MNVRQGSGGVEQILDANASSILNQSVRIESSFKKEPPFQRNLTIGMPDGYKHDGIQFNTISAINESSVVLDD